MPYSWDPRIARYRDDDTGRLVKRSIVLQTVDGSIAASTTAQPVTIDGIVTAGSDFLAQAVGNGLMDPNDWRNLMRGEIKREYIRQYALGIGGLEQMTPARWGSIGGMLAEQYRYLDGMTAEIAAGQLSEGQIRTRARMYINSAREGYERANEQAQVAIGATEVLWVLQPGAKHCGGCEDFAAMGWQPIADDPYDGCVPGQACTPCLSSCQCHREFR